MTRLEALDARYREHQKDRDEFVFGSSDRASVIAELVGGADLRVLDLGCRTGALTKHFAHGNRVTGLDIDHEALARARDRLGIETVWGNVEDGLPFEDGSFDVVVAGELLEHLAMPTSVVTEAHRVLAAGGRFVGSVPNAFRLKSRLRFLAGRHPETDPTHLQLFTPSALQALLSDFDSVELRFAVGRYVRLQPRLMARCMIFAARTAAPSTT
jgi:SAM-dependent methyltransferase